MSFEKPFDLNLDLASDILIAGLSPLGFKDKFKEGTKLRLEGFTGKVFVEQEERMVSIELNGKKT